MALNRKLKFGATSGGLTGLITSLFFVLLHKHIPADALVSVPAFLTFAVHVVVSYFTAETRIVLKPGEIVVHNITPEEQAEAGKHV